MGRGGVKTKWRQGACYWLWNLCVKIFALMKKDPSQFRKRPEQCFLRPDLNFFLEFRKKKLFSIIVTLKMTIKKYFFVKKTCQKNLPTKLVKKICEKKNWKSTFFYRKYFLMVILRVTIMVNNFFFRNSKKKIRSGLKKHCSGHFLNWLGSFFITASILTRRFHSQ